MRVHYSRAAVPNLLGTRDGFFGIQFFHRLGVGVVVGCFKCITFIMHFISIIITSALPQITRH